MPQKISFKDSNRQQKSSAGKLLKSFSCHLLDSNLKDVHGLIVGVQLNYKCLRAVTETHMGEHYKLGLVWAVHVNIIVICHGPRPFLFIICKRVVLNLIFFSKKLKSVFFQNFKLLLPTCHDMLAFTSYSLSEKSYEYIRINFTIQ